jgi:hypothetical protein
MHFSQHQIFWDCTGMSACETLPAGLPLPLDQQAAMDRHWRLRLQSSTRGTKPLSGIDGDSLEDLWASSVRTYTGLNLTNQSDKRMAIWGIAKRIRDMLNEEYFAGMWEGAVEEQLGWRVADCEMAERPQTLSDIPTWSWASMNAVIHIPDRSRQRRRSWFVGNPLGERLSIALSDRNSRDISFGSPSKTAADMERKLNLASRRREQVRAALKLKNATDTSQYPASTASREMEPELLDKRVAIRSTLNKGYLMRSHSAPSWSLEIPNTHDQRTDIVAHPDTKPEADSVAVVFIVLALTMRPDWKSDEEEDDTAWYEGHGLMLARDTTESCFRRVGALEIRRLSPAMWHRLRMKSTCRWNTEAVSNDDDPYVDFHLV